MSRWWETTKSLVVPIVPQSIRRWRYRRLASETRRRYAGVSPAETFTDVYRRNGWGGEAGTFYSGKGSDDALAEPYSAAVSAFIVSSGARSVVDLGCGDARVGIRLLRTGAQYTGVDVVAGLIDQNNTNYAASDTRFICLDIIEDELPEGDICLIRQVFQHLSNEQILRVLSKCRRYKWLIVTEEHPARLLAANVDKPHGPDTRMGEGSGVYLDLPPFNQVVSPLCKVPLPHRYGALHTVLIEH